MVREHGRGRDLRSEDVTGGKAPKELTLSELEEMAAGQEKIQESRHLALMNAKERLHNKWSFVIILACMINIATGLQLFSNQDINSKAVVWQLGIATLLMWWSLNKYLRFTRDYSYLPRTFLSSADSVLAGLIGVMPVIVGVCTFSSIILYTNFRYKDTEHTIFTFFYMIQGDTFFDSGTGSNQANYLYSLFWYFFWASFFGIFVIMQVTLAQVEDGYLASKHQHDFDFITKKLEDPVHQQSSHAEHVLHTSLTIPEAMKRLNLRLQTQGAKRGEKVRSQIRGLREEQPDAARPLKRLANVLEIEEYAAGAKKVKSKRNLLNMLSLEEMEWHQRGRSLAASTRRESMAQSSFAGVGKVAPARQSAAK